MHNLVSIWQDRVAVVTKVKSHRNMKNQGKVLGTQTKKQGKSLPETSS